MRTLLERIWSKTPCIVAGLMSGTSLDGVDAVIARLSGHQQQLQIELLSFVQQPYPEVLRTLLLHNSTADTSSVLDLSQLHVRLAHVYAAAIHEALTAAGLSAADLDLVGSHGQTVHHVPEPTDCAGMAVTSTLQVGDASVLANLLGVPVVGDFRLADMALGGQGAPLAPYFDFACFTHPAETRGLLNLGGIANLTTLLPDGAAHTVQAFDTGPANMVMDALAQHFFDLPYDPAGRLAAAGTVHEGLLLTLLDDDYLAQAPPKSTGRERYGRAYVEHVLAHSATCDPNDVLATVTLFTARSIHDAYTRFIAPTHTLDVLIASGGGIHNTHLMAHLSDLFAPIPVRILTDYGVDPDAKEALCFATLAYETVHGYPTNLPSVTGASHETLLGKLCLPYG